MGANEPRGMANLDPRGMVGRIYEGDHLTYIGGSNGYPQSMFLSRIKNKRPMGHNAHLS